ncbi:hypothetical protein C6P46_002779 [Rhodotorula mucilaginosa]|uniref:LysM domain-containing protein n=1 Tax=Rhodotorula mucilaginosa TaxID=5537 RepID=A0A9P6VTJ4_RHOMI|nr:hypothetical protein C6P46_002779 [Rhodotorula mucilaginosa]
MAPALQPPSRTATPTPIDALLAPLHLGSPASPPSSPSTAAPGGLRSRKSTTALNTATNGSSSGLLLFGTDSAPPSDSSNTTALGIATSVNGGAAGWHSPRRGGLQAADANGKGKARAVEQQHDATLPSQEREREVIVHKVLKADSIASISLKYGITPQALRASNRLWPSDPLFLRSELLIPLDQCHLPSLSQQHDVELAQAARRRRHHEMAGEDGDEDGDLMGWDAAAAASGKNARRSRSGSQAEGEPPPPPAIGTSQQQRRGGSLLDMSGQTTPDLTPTESTARESSEFLTIWDDDDDNDNPHGKVLTPDIISSSLQYGGEGSITITTTTVTNPFELATGLHLDGSTTSSSAAAAATPGVHSLLREEIEAAVPDGAGGSLLEREGSRPSTSSRLLRNSNNDDTLTTPPTSPLRRSSVHNGPSARSPSSPSTSSSSTTPLRIKRLPASELAFFPAPSSGHSSAPSSASLARLRPRQGTTRTTADAASLTTRDDDPDSSSSLEERRSFFLLCGKKWKERRRRRSDPLTTFAQPRTVSTTHNTLSQRF